MNDPFVDLKEFIEAQFEASERRYDRKLKDVAKELKVLCQEMAAGFAGVAEVISSLNDDWDKRHNNHEHRITQLE